MCLCLLVMTLISLLHDRDQPQTTESLVVAPVGDTVLDCWDQPPTQLVARDALATKAVDVNHQRSTAFYTVHFINPTKDTMVGGWSQSCKRPLNYLLDDRVTLSVRTDESLTPGCPPRLTQRTVGKFLQPLTRELWSVPPRPTVQELPDSVKDNMVLRDKAFWVDKPGANAYTLHDAYYNYGMSTVMVKPTHQDVFPRSYQYDLDCVKYRRYHGCDGLKQPIKDGKKVPLKAYCRDCDNKKDRGLTPFQIAWANDPGQRRWRNYPDLSATLTDEEIRASMNEVGRPFQNEACNWYYKNFPSVKHPVIIRKFSK